MSSTRKIRPGLARVRVAASALLCRPVGLHVLPWIPCLVYYLWLNGRYFSAVEFATAAHKLEALVFLCFQSVLLFLIIVLIDGLLAARPHRIWRMGFVTLVHLFFASLYIDSILYKVMSVHLTRGIQLLCQGGLSQLPINWAHTGISREALRSCLGWALAATAGLVAYSGVMVWLSPRPNPVIKAGRLLAALAYAVLACQILSVGDDPQWSSSFGGLKSALPVYVGSPVGVPGRRYAIPAIRPLRNQEMTSNAVVSANTNLSTRPDIFVFVLESTRGDFINPEVTPNLASLAQECLKFPDSLAAGNASHISWYSLLTANFGVYFAMEKRSLFHEGSVPIALFKHCGYKVNVLCSSTLDYHNIDKIAFGSNLVLCDSLVDEEKRGIVGASERDCEVVNSLLKALEHPPGGRLFLVFFHASHHDYDFPKDEPTPFVPYARTWNYSNFSIDNEELKLVMNRYRNALHFQDRLIGQVLSTLKAKGLYEKAVIAAIGDHGEEFLEHGKLVHASNLYRPQTHVPFLLRFPSGTSLPGQSSHRFPTPSHVDLLPTLLDYLGIATGGPFDGESLFHKTGNQVLITAENSDFDPFRFCIQSAKYKAFFQYENQTAPTAGRRTLYLTQLTDANDIPLKIDLFSTDTTELLSTNCEEVLSSLYPAARFGFKELRASNSPKQ